MAIGKVARGGLIGIVVRWASRLRFPYIFLLTAALFAFNLFIYVGAGHHLVPLANVLVQT
jgi:hypothetical protein